MNDLWLKQFKANYEGTSEQAKALEGLVKTGGREMLYVPWAAMERLMYEQDPDTNFEVVPCALYGDSALVHTSKFNLRTLDDATDKKRETSADFFVHMVVVKVTFLGKTVIEYYPVQDSSTKAMSAPKVIDANLVNRAIQRAKAKAGSRVSGLALKLYEGLDLQFDDDDPTPLPTTPKKESNKKVATTATQVVVTATPVATPIATPVTTTEPEPEAGTPVLQEALYLFKNKELLKDAIVSTNGLMQKKFGFVIDPENDTVEQISEKMSKMAEPASLIRVIKNKAGITE